MFQLLLRWFGMTPRVRRAMRTMPYHPPPFNPPPMSPDDPAVRHPSNRGPRPNRPSAAAALLEPDDDLSEPFSANRSRSQ